MTDLSAFTAAAVSPINWEAYFASIDAELRLEPGRMADEIARNTAESGRFQNTDYPTSLTPVMVSRAFHDFHAARVSAYLELLEKVARMVVDSPVHQAYFGLTPDEVTLAAAPVWGERIVEICRLDGYIDATSGHLKILEHNADSPAGTFFTPRLNRVIRATLNELAPEFQNTDYPTSLTPVMVSRAFHDFHAARVSAYLELLEKVARMVVDSPVHQAYFGLTPDEVTLAAAPVWGERIVEICRLDGYIDATSGHLKILEHNADSPAGTFFTPRLNRVIRATLNELAPEIAGRIAATQFDDPMTLWNFLATRMPDDGPMRLEIVQETGKSNVESQEMANAMRALGHACKVSNLAEIGDANVLWNKINTVFWRETVGRRPDLLPIWSEIVADPARQPLNHFAARVIVENKRCLAFMQDPRHRDLFSTEELSLVEQICPWAAICDDAIEVTWRGTTGPLRDLLIENKDAFVLKQPFDIRGDGVSIGKDCSESDWRALIDQGFDYRYIIQEYIPPVRLPIVTRSNGWMPVTMMNTSLDTFVFGGRVVGYGAKASTHNRVNLFKGGRKLSTLIGAV